MANHKKTLSALITKYENKRKDAQSRRNKADNGGNFRAGYTHGIRADFCDAVVKDLKYLQKHL